MTPATNAQLADALKGLTQGLEADGYALDARWSDEGKVALRIDAGPEACADCLAPSAVMRSIAQSMLSGAGIDVNADDVVVTYPEGSAAP